MKDVDSSYTNITKKCGACGQWSHATGSVDDVCEHCGAYLEPREREAQIKREAEKEAKKKLPWKDPVFIVTVKPGDNFIVQIGKRIVQFGQLIFMTLVSIALWIAAALAG